ncbi:MAG: hypothetical protein ACHQAY_27450 [Hyphomicrobiales bacterium]
MERNFEAREPVGMPAHHRQARREKRHIEGDVDAAASLAQCQE